MFCTKFVEQNKPVVCSQLSLAKLGYVYIYMICIHIYIYIYILYIYIITELRQGDSL